MAGFSRRKLISLSTAALFAGITTPTAIAGPPSLLRMFGKSKPVDQADSYLLSEEDGPWLLLATTFVGENAKQRAERTAIEVRQKLRLPAFIYQEDFDFTGVAEQDQETGRRARYVNPHQYEAYAVLVGEYDSVNHESIDRDLERLKTVELEVFRDKEELEAEYNTTNPASMIKAFGEQLFRSRKGRGRNPLAAAFVTRNPLLPESFFRQPEVDSFVKQLNEGLSHSLLDAEGKFTVIVRTFDGCGTIVGAKNQDKFKPSAERMQQFAKQADKMVRELRKAGEEAYQYHDRHRSIVTIGTFDNLGRELPGGHFQYAPEITRVMQQYSALNASKTRKITGQPGVAANHIAMIPFDVQPTPIAIPRVSKRSLYSGRVSRR
jgi:hypothetical protein